MTSKGRIVNVSRNEHRITYVHQGVKKSQQHFWNMRCQGGKGTYVVGGEYLGTSVDVKIYIYDLGKSFSFDIRDAILQANECKKMSSNLLKHVQQNEGEKVIVEINHNSVSFDPRQLPYLKK